MLMNPHTVETRSRMSSHISPSDMRSSETADLFMVLIMYRLKRNGRAAVIVPDGFLFGADNTKIAIKTKLLRDFNLHTIIRLPGSIFAPYTSIATNIFVLRQHPVRRVLQRAILQRKRGSIVWICLRVTSISPRQNP